MSVISVVEINNVEDCFDYDNDLMVVTLEDASDRHQLEIGDFNGLWENRSLEMKEQKDVFPKLDEDFHLKYKFIGMLTLWEGRTAVFIPRFMFEMGFEIASNPTISLSEVKRRRFSTVESQSIADIQSIEDERIFDMINKEITDAKSSDN